MCVCGGEGVWGGQAADRVKCIKAIMKFDKLQMKSMSDITKGIRKWYGVRMLERFRAKP